MVEPRSHYVKELGQKARARLENEKAKRREIVILEESTAPPNQKRKASPSIRFPTAAAAAKTRRAATTSRTNNNVDSAQKKKRLAVAAQQVRKKNGNSSETAQIDQWHPDVSNLPAYTRAQSSSVVQLHGIPIGTTSHTIVNRFFAGLQVEFVFTIPPNDDNPHIAVLDAQSTQTIKNLHQQQQSIDRLDATTMRIFVKFQSIAAACLAVERSFETLPVGGTNINSSGGSDGGVTIIKHATICVTMIEKELGAFLTKRMAIQIDHTSSGKEISLDKYGTEILQRRTTSADVNANRILWSHAFRQVVALKQQSSLSSPPPHESLLLDHRKLKHVIATNPPTLMLYCRLAKYYNRIADIADQVRMHHQKQQLESMQPQQDNFKDMKMTKSLATITQNAIAIAEDELQRMETILYRMRFMLTTDNDATKRSDGH
mmetsp:Transcript_24778/g.69575  ORF Transcript_24778/g.69575 Transcript_24778/m.69575 type:complete len:431 (-) Transcript_24778:67-1359(-)